MACGPIHFSQLFSMLSVNQSMEMGRKLRNAFKNNISYSTWETGALLVMVRESSFNMTRGGDEDIETRSLKF